MLNGFLLSAHDFVFYVDKRRELANAIIMHEYSLSIMDHVDFRKYSTALQPVFQVPYRNTIKREIFRIYQEERSITLKLLVSLQWRVAITSDMWTASNQKKGYMTITAHYIDASWNLKSQILRYVKNIELFLYYCWIVAL